MLITTCTHCLARFRVAPQQLNARQGQVRCGKCGEIFSGFEALERVPDDDTGSRLLAAREALEKKPPVEAQPPDDLPELETVEPAPASPPGRRISNPPSAHVAAPAGQTPPHAERPHVAEAIAEPLDLAPVREPVARAWSFGAVLLLFVLAMEAAYALRTPLAQRYPLVRPWLESACTRIGCAVHWSRDERLLKLEDSQLLEVPGKPDEIALGARIRNLASVAQEYPDLELTLTDIGGQPAARRVLRPADYLGHAVASDDVLAAGGEVAIQLRLETTGLKPTGYELLVFYP